VGVFFFLKKINNLLCGACRQTTVAKKRPRDYNPAMHIVNAPPTLSKHEVKKRRYRKKGMTTYRKRKVT